MNEATVAGNEGKPLTSLKKDDIEIYEDGVKQNLAVFELEAHAAHGVAEQEIFVVRGQAEARRLALQAIGSRRSRVVWHWRRSR